MKELIMGDKSELQLLQEDIAQWADEVFGDDRKICGEIHHLVEKARELLHSPDDIMQYADCLILMLNALSQCGLSTYTLLEVARIKMEVNKRRDWGMPDERGVVHHLKELTSPE